MSLGAPNHKMQALWQLVSARVDTMARRDRLALMGIGLGLLIAAELLLVMPMRSTRMNIASAAADQLRSEEDAATQAREARDQALALQKTTLAKLERELAALGVGTTRGQSLSFLLSRTLRGSTVRVVSLRELNIESIEPAAAEASAEAAAAAPKPDTPATTLFRHRFELRLSGEVAALTSAVLSLETETRPLRLERVKLESSNGSAVHATIVLAVIGTERLWLSI